MPKYAKLKVEGIKVSTFTVVELGASRLKNGDMILTQTDFGRTLCDHYKPHLVLDSISELDRGLKNGAWEIVETRDCIDVQGFDDMKADRSMSGRQSKRKRQQEAEAT